MKTTNKIMEKIIYPACFFFTVAIFTTSAIATIAAQTAFYPTFAYMGLLLLYSLYMSFINNIFALKLNSILKVLIHFVCTIAGFIFVFVICSGFYVNGRSAIFISIMGILIYIILMATIIVVKSILNRKKNAAEKYKSQFGM